MARGARKRKSTTSKRRSPSRNWADVAYHAVDSLYNLANTGNLIGVLLFGIVILTWILTYRMPEADLIVLVSGLGSFFLGEKFYTVPLLMLLAFCIFLKIRMNKVYKNEIQRLTDVRKELIHGFQSGTLVPLENHTTSDYNITK